MKDHIASATRTALNNKVFIIFLAPLDDIIIISIVVITIDAIAVVAVTRTASFLLSASFSLSRQERMIVVDWLQLEKRMNVMIRWCNNWWTRSSSSHTNNVFSSCSLQKKPVELFFLSLPMFVECTSSITSSRTSAMCGGKSVPRTLSSRTIYLCATLWTHGLDDHCFQSLEAVAHHYLLLLALYHTGTNTTNLRKKQPMLCCTSCSGGFTVLYIFLTLFYSTVHVESDCFSRLQYRVSTGTVGTGRYSILYCGASRS